MRSLCEYRKKEGETDLNPAQNGVVDTSVTHSSLLPLRVDAGETLNDTRYLF